MFVFLIKYKEIKVSQLLSARLSLCSTSGSPMFSFLKSFLLSLSSEIMPLALLSRSYTVALGSLRLVSRKALNSVQFV